jgi:ankyrin repeat protein
VPLTINFNSGAIYINLLLLLLLKMDTKLKEAVAKVSLELVRAAISDGADVNYMVELDKEDPLYKYMTSKYSQEQERIPVLTLAVKNGNVEEMKELIQAGADVNLRSSGYHVSPSHVAIACSSLER